MAFLWVPLIFVVIHLLDAQVKTAQKGPKPRQGLSWTVHIPEQDSNNNLYGYFPGTHNIYDDTGEQGDGVLIDVITSQGGMEQNTRLRLVVGNNIDEFGHCVGWEDGYGIRKIGFHNIIPGEYWTEPTIDDEYPCFFPPSLAGTPPGCMADFLNGLHPYDGGCDPGCTHPECCYYCVEVKAEINRLIEDVVGYEEVTGTVWINLVNTYDLQSGCEYPHNIEGYCPFDDPGENYNIEKTGDNTWTLTVDGTFLFAETYKGIKEGKGKGGKGTWEDKTPYWVEIPLRFEMDWTRAVE